MYTVSGNEPVSISPPGTAIAGESYTLECFVLTQSNTEAHPIIMWLDPMNITVPSGRISTFGSMSTLTFSHLRVSETGIYTCETATGRTSVRVTVNGKQ